MRRGVGLLGGEAPGVHGLGGLSPRTSTDPTTSETSTTRAVVASGTSATTSMVTHGRNAVPEMRTTNGMAEWAGASVGERLGLDDVLLLVVVLVFFVV